MTTPKLRPMTGDELVARGFCRCPQRSGPGSAAEPGPAGVCGVHPDGVESPEQDRIARGLVFFDDRRDRHVTWPDAVEAMRQGRYAAAAGPDLVMFTWRNLMQLLATLRAPLAPVAPISESEADELIAWAGLELSTDQLRWLLVLARGGGAATMCELFGVAVRQAGAR